MSSLDDEEHNHNELENQNENSINQEENNSQEHQYQEDQDNDNGDQEEGEIEEPEDGEENNQEAEEPEDVVEDNQEAEDPEDGVDDNQETEEHDDEKKIAENSDEEEFAGFGDEEIEKTNEAKKRQILSDDSDQNEFDEENDEVVRKKKKKQNKKESNNEEVEGDEEIEGVEEEADLGEVEADNQESEARKSDEEMNDDDEESESIQPNKRRKEGQSYLEQVLSQQKAENRRHRKRNIDSEELNEMDNKISAIITEMKTVAADDRDANEKSLTAIGKLRMLPIVITLLQKSDYHATMIELGILGAIAEWLAPLPDRSLPNIKIREELIEALRDFGDINSDYLKSSGIGKASMFLYKHPKETKSNKLKLEKIINNWARPIFNLDSNFKQLTKEERFQRDIEHVKSLNRRSSNENSNNQSVDDMMNIEKYKSNKKKSKDESGTDEPKKSLRPGDPGFVPRARVPLPSSKDYINRPKSNVENLELSDKKIKKSETLLDKHKKRFIEIQKNSKYNRAVTMSVSK